MPASPRTSSIALIPVAAAVLTAAALLSAPAASATEASATRVEPPHQPTLVGTYHRPRPAARVLRALSIMRAQQGDPYAYGAAGPNAFDCSGLVYFGTHRAGFKGVPRTSSAQAGYMRHIPRRAMRVGDFLFFTSGGHVYHVGVFVGRNTILHAPYPGARVRKERIWTSSWFVGTLRGR